MIAFSKKILLLFLFAALHSCGDRKNLNEPQQQEETCNKTCDEDREQEKAKEKEEREKEKAELLAEIEKKNAQEKEEREKEKAQLLAEIEEKNAKEKAEREKEKAELLAEIEKKNAEALLRIEEEKKELEALYEKFSSIPSLKFNWKNVKEAAMQFLKIKVPNSKNIPTDEYELKTELLAARITKVVFYLDLNKAKVDDTCYSSDISEIQNKCIPIYYGYARTF